MTFRIYPPEGHSVGGCYLQLKGQIRTYAQNCTLRRTPHGYFKIAGPIPELIMLKLQFGRFGYRLTNREEP